jgi:DNA-directed RNA polymerase subunit RPC12/RpoP
MQKMDLTCPRCGAAMAYEPADRLLRCPHCGLQMLVDDGRVQVDGDSFLEAGYRFEQGRILARQEAEEQERRRQAEAEAAARQELERQKVHNWSCFWGSLILAFASLFFPEWVCWACAAGIVTWAFADRRVTRGVRIWVVCMALYIFLWRLIFG